MPITHAPSAGPQATVGLSTAAELTLARVVTNAGRNFAGMLDLVAQDICAVLPVCGLDGASGKYRRLAPEELVSCRLKHGALVLVTAAGAVFTQLSVLREDLEAYFARLDRLDAGDWITPP